MTAGDDAQEWDSRYAGSDRVWSAAPNAWVVAARITRQAPRSTGSWLGRWSWSVTPCATSPKVLAALRRPTISIS